jgi:hypothetical protein
MMYIYKMADPQVCFISAVFGNYESTCKPFLEQTVPSDFICFTDNPNIRSNGWIIDTTPYHRLNPSPIDDGSYTNSFANNGHTFNIAKYYKQAFRNIPRLQKYKVIVWLDGTVEITNSRVSEFILRNIEYNKIITWHHEMRDGYLHQEVAASRDFYKYASTFWNGQSQPYQYVDLQYLDYLKDGYSETYFREMYPERRHFGVWLTCFVAFLQHDSLVAQFLDMWYLQTLKYTTQDQIGFPYVCQKMGVIPQTLPNEEVQGYRAHTVTDFYIKRGHGE